MRRVSRPDLRIWNSQGMVTKHAQMLESFRSLIHHLPMRTPRSPFLTFRAAAGLSRGEEVLLFGREELTRPCCGQIHALVDQCPVLSPIATS